MQRDGFWVLIGIRYRYENDRLKFPEKISHTFAHYDAHRWSWTVNRNAFYRRCGVDDAAKGTPAAPRWVTSRELAVEEEWAIARIAEETSMLLDVATRLHDGFAAYTDLATAMMQRAENSSDPDDIHRIGAVLKPYAYLPQPIGAYFRVGAFGRLEELARPLYRELAGKPQADTSGVLATATVSE